MWDMSEMDYGDSFVGVVNGKEGFRGDYRFLSNFYDCEIEIDGVNFKSVEFFYMRSKCETDEDRALILNAETAGKAKRIGRKVKVRDGFFADRVDIMHRGVREKFLCNDDLRKKLVDCEGEIVEVNSWNDTFWGVGLDGKGKNMLGKILMKVRSEI